MIIRHGIVAIRETEEEGSFNVLHFVGYEYKPDEKEMDRLEDELRTSEEFGLIGEEFILIRATQELVDEILEKYENASDSTTIVEHGKETLN